MKSDNFNIAKAGSEVSKIFSEVMTSFLHDPLDTVILEGHRQLIEGAVAGESIDMRVIDFLCGYKKLVTQQKRKKDIAEKALAFLEDSAKPKEIQEDWLEFFFEKAKLVINCDMQLIWAKLLAEEANNPGKISLSLLHTLSVMSYEQAELFCNISRFALRAYKKEDVNLLIFIVSNSDVYKNSGITPSGLKELERFGLIECDFNQEYIFRNKIVFLSGNRMLTVYGDPNNQNKIKSGNVMFAKDGKVLYDIIDSDYKKHRNDILRFAIKNFKVRNCRVFVDGQYI